ncbi:membrane lipoprotein lipid attachment site-containing protein [Solibacillus sp. FSL W8-0372]|uniref:membrane lipoprotein lipid attachment site-containing protein n=1 Tax=Solibacillus sp. FSL W8-0372 TaxID=2921713 RepID=UPI0030CB7F9F
MKKILPFLFTMFVLTGCSEQNEMEGQGVIDTEAPLVERVEAEMKKNTNKLENIFQGQFDDREIAFATYYENLEEDVYPQTDYTLSEEKQEDLLNYIKSIEVKLYKEDFYQKDEDYDFWIIRPQYYYLDGPTVAVDLDHKILSVSGEGLMPNAYKVVNQEDEVFEKLVELFHSSERQERNY